MVADSSNKKPPKVKAKKDDLVAVNTIRMLAVDAVEKAKASQGKPTAIIAHTVKGKGVSFAENNPAFHHNAMTQEQYEQALKELS